MDEVTQEALDAVFPYGVVVAQDGERPNYNMIDLKVMPDESKLVLLGWAYPNKDMFFFPTGIELDGDGDWIFRSEGQRYRFAPLSEEAAKQERSMMLEA